MSQEDWAARYATMDQRLLLQYEQLPRGEQIGEKPEQRKQDTKKS